MCVWAGFGGEVVAIWGRVGEGSRREREPGKGEVGPDFRNFVRANRMLLSGGGGQGD